MSADHSLDEQDLCFAHRERPIFDAAEIPARLEEAKARTKAKTAARLAQWVPWYQPQRPTVPRPPAPQAPPLAPTGCVSVPWIEDKALYAAVQWARQLRKKEGAAIAVSIAARHYGVDPTEVGRHLAYLGVAIRKARS